MHIPQPEARAFDRQASWLAIGSLTVGSFALVTTELLPIGVLPSVARNIGISDGLAGLMVTMPALLAALAAPLSIVVAAQMDRRRVLLVLMALLIASNILVATATGLLQLLAGRVLIGIAVGSFWTIAGSLGPRLRHGVDGIRANALILAGVSIGTVAGVPAGALIVSLAGWRWAFAAAASLGAVAVIAMLALLPPVPAGNSAGLKTIPEILREGRARIGLVASLLAFLGQFTAYTYVTPFLEVYSGVNEGTISAVLLVGGIAGFLGNLTGGWLSGRFLRASAIAMAVLLGSSIMLLELTGQDLVPAIALVIVWGFGFGMLPIAMQSWVQSMAPGHLDGVQALFVTVAQLGIGVGALAGGVIVDHVGIDSALVTGGVSVLLAALVVSLSGDRQPSAATVALDACPN